MKSFIVMVKILVKICNSQYSVKLFGIGTLCWFKNMNNLKKKQQLTILGLIFHFILFSMHSQRSQKYFLSLTLIPYWNSLKIKEYYYNGGHKAVQKGRLPTLSFCFQPTPASNKLQNSTIIQWVDLLYGSAIWCHHIRLWLENAKVNIGWI